MAQFAFYLLAGSVVTLVDLFVYNLLAAPPLRWPRVYAHLISTACAMLAGFTLHCKFVFRPSELLLAERLPKYILIVICSAYLLQTSIIYFLTSLWTAPAQLVRSVASWFGTTEATHSDWIDRNFVKTCAICSGLVFNYLFFKFFVYSNG